MFTMKRVNIIKLVLSLFALSIIIASIAWFLLKNDHHDIKNASLHYDKIVLEEKSMINPQYQGIDKDGKPFTITAKRAVQEDEHTISLFDIDAHMRTEKENYISLIAKRGLFTHDENKITLFDSVSLFADEGYEIETESALIYIKEGTMEGSNKITVKKHGTFLTAYGFKITDKGQKIHFSGPVSLHYHFTPT